MNHRMVIMSMLLTGVLTACPGNVAPIITPDLTISEDALEAAVRAAINTQRSQATDCTETNAEKPEGEKVYNYVATTSLSYSKVLNWSARDYAKKLSARTNPGSPPTLPHDYQGQTAATRNRFAPDVFDWEYLGENLGYLTSDNSKTNDQLATILLDGWLKSKNGHCGTIMRANTTDIGVGIARDSNGNIYFAVAFTDNNPTSAH